MEDKAEKHKWDSGELLDRYRDEFISVTGQSIGVFKLGFVTFGLFVALFGALIELQDTPKTDPFFYIYPTGAIFSWIASLYLCSKAYILASASSLLIYDNEAFKNPRKNFHNDLAELKASLYASLVFLFAFPCCL